MSDTTTSDDAVIELPKRPRGLGRIYPDTGGIIRVELGVRGKMHRKSTGLRGKAGLRAAEKLLKVWLEQKRTKFIGPREEKVTVGQLLDALLVEHEVNGRRSIRSVRFRVARLRPVFGNERAVDLTAARVETYKKARLGEAAQPATINRELAALRRAYRLAIQQELISRAPAISLLPEHNVRTGFVEPATFETITTHLPAPLDDVARFAYLAGWRKGEVLTLAWTDIDRARGLITLRREHSKNNEPRVLPLPSGSELAAIIERRWTARTVTRPDGTRVLADLVFHRDGAPIECFRTSWRKATAAAGVPGLLFHDLRRSAVRNLTRAGVSQTIAMRITGHKTASVFRRYDIVDLRDQRDALAKVEAFVAGDQRRTVVPLAEKRAARKGRA